jgi:hypothetical protein
MSLEPLPPQGTTPWYAWMTTFRQSIIDALNGKSASGHAHSGTYDPAGTAAAGDGAHLLAVNPHPEYLTPAEGNAAYDALGAAGAAQSAAEATAAGALSSHSSDTTAIHGIADTSALVVTSDGRLSDARTPTAHAASHGSAGADPVTIAQSQVTGLTTELGLKIPATEKGAGNGVATLDAGGQIPAGQIPAVAITEYLGTVANEAAMLALTGQMGDWAIRSDLGTVFVITGANTTIIAGWTQLAYPASAVVSVNGDTGAVVLTAADVGAATSAQGALADTAVQPGDLAAVATSGAYADLTGTPAAGLPVFGTWSYDQADTALPVSNGTFTLSIVKGFVTSPANYSLFLSGTAIEGSRSSLLGTIRVGDVLELRSADNAYRLRMTATTTWAADTIGVTVVAGTSWSSVPDGTVMTLFVYPVNVGQPIGLPGANGALGRWVGTTSSLAPASGTFLQGDLVTTLDGKAFICTVAGTPGTWTQVGGGSGYSTMEARSGFVVTQRTSSSSTTKVLNVGPGHGFLVGDVIDVVGVGAGFNGGPFTVTVSAYSAITYIGPASADEFTSCTGQVIKRSAPASRSALRVRGPNADAVDATTRTDLWVPGPYPPLALNGSASALVGGTPVAAGFTDYQTEKCAPIFVPAGAVIGQIGARVQYAATAGGVMRFGIRQDEVGGPFSPGLLLQDCGTLAAIGFAGTFNAVMNLASPWTCPADGFYWFSITFQTNAASFVGCREFPVAANPTHAYDTSLNATFGTKQHTGVTGALPTAAPTGTPTNPGRVPEIYVTRTA